MGQVNNHVKDVLGIKNKPKPRYKTDYTKTIVWVILAVITIAIWTTIYNLIF
jgi:hypothetical protein